MAYRGPLKACFFAKAGVRPAVVAEAKKAGEEALELRDKLDVVNKL